LKVIQTLPRINVGGVERGVMDLVKYYRETDLESIVVSGGGKLLDTFQRYGVKHYTLNVYKKSPISILSIPKFRDIILSDSVDIVHARSRVPGWISFFATRNTDTHFVTTAHGLYKTRLSSEVMGWGKFVICPSNVVARHMREKYNVPQEKIIIINRWVDLSVFKFTDYDTRFDNGIIMTMGRLSPSKGYEHLIHAFHKLLRKKPYLKLKIIGGVDKSKQRYFQYLKTLIARYSLTHCVEFTGVASDAHEYLRHASLFVAPSVSDESFGRVIVEAQASGIPVIASNVGGYNEIIKDGFNGLLVEKGDVEGIAHAMNKLLEDKNLARQMISNARNDVVEKYSMERCLDEIKHVYDRVLAETRILVIKLSSLGDLILIIPSLKKIREKYPNGKITLLTSVVYASFFKHCPYIDDVLIVDKDYKNLKSLIQLAQKLRRMSFDYIIDLQNNKFSHILTFLSFPRRSFGFSLRFGRLLTNKIKYDRNMDPLVSQSKILDMLGIESAGECLSMWDIPSSGGYDLPNTKLIGIVMSASKRWASKNWPFDNLFKFLELINKDLYGYKVVLIGDEYSAERASKLENIIYPRPINLCGKTTLTDLPYVISKCSVVISPDTALLHLAQSLNVPTVGLFGPTDPNRHSVKSETLKIFNHKMNCSYCYKPACVLDNQNDCMGKILPQEVFNYIKKILAKD